MRESMNTRRTFGSGTILGATRKASGELIIPTTQTRVARRATQPIGSHLLGQADTTRLPEGRYKMMMAMCDQTAVPIMMLILDHDYVHDFVFFIA